MGNIFIPLLSIRKFRPWREYTYESWRTLQKLAKMFKSLVVAFVPKVELSPRQKFTFDGIFTRELLPMTQMHEMLSIIIDVVNYTADDCGNKLPT